MATNYRTNDVSITVFVWFAAILFALTASFFLGGWLMMLLLSLLHAWWPTIPTMGYWTSAWAALLLRTLLISPTGQTKANK